MKPERAPLDPQFAEFLTEFARMMVDRDIASLTKGTPIRANTDLRPLLKHASK